jgi:putative ABC transport system ATP-binding protein
MPLAYAGMGGPERRRRAREALARFGLTDRENHRPARLSGGEQQRVALARAAINHPRLLLADEPTGALDEASADEVMRLFAELNQSGATIVLATHNMSIAARARRVLRFRCGCLEGEASSPNSTSPASPSCWRKRTHWSRRKRSMRVAV